MSQNQNKIVYGASPKPKPTPKQTTVLKFGEEPKKQTQKPKNLDDDENQKTRYVKPEVSLSISRDRLLLGWKQKELAEKSGVAESVVREYENGKAIHQQHEYQKIRNALDKGKK